MEKKNHKYTWKYHALILLIYETCGKKISKDSEDLTNAINQFDIIDIFRTLKPTTQE